MIAFTRAFTATAGDIDQLGHVNNAVWVRWVQELATAHWEAQALPEHVAAFIWVVVRHEIDFLGNIARGETSEGQTWVSESPRGAKMDRHAEFVRDGKVLVRAKTTWAIIDKATQRLVRVPKDVAARFVV